MKGAKSDMPVTDIRIEGDTIKLLTSEKFTTKHKGIKGISFTATSVSDTPTVEDLTQILIDRVSPRMASLSTLIESYSGKKFTPTRVAELTENVESLNAKSCLSRHQKSKHRLPLKKVSLVSVLCSRNKFAGDFSSVSYTHHTPFNSHLVIIYTIYNKLLSK